jgi:hypothetical protein
VAGFPSRSMNLALRRPICVSFQDFSAKPRAAQTPAATRRTSSSIEANGSPAGPPLTMAIRQRASTNTASSSE